MRLLTPLWLLGTLTAGCLMAVASTAEAVAAPPDDTNPPEEEPPGDRGERARLEALLRRSQLIAGVATDETPPVIPAALGGRPEDAPEVQGGGGGGVSSCSWAPLGPIAEVAAAQAAVNALQTPVVDNPSIVEDVIRDPGGVQPVQVLVTDWYRLTGPTPEIKARELCDGVLTRVGWLPLVPDGSGGLQLQITAQDLLPGARDRVIRRLPTPQMRITPADEDANGFTYVQNRTFFWVDQGPGQWDTVSATASAGGITVTVQAVPVRLVVDPGDGNKPLVCEGAPPAVTKAAYHPDIEGCSYIYRHSSATAPNGETFPVEASIVWHATWSASTGEGGDLGYLSTTSDVRDLAVAEIQAIIIDSDP